MNISGGCAMQTKQNNFFSLCILLILLSTFSVHAAEVANLTVYVKDQQGNNVNCYGTAQCTNLIYGNGTVTIFAETPIFNGVEANGQTVY